mgnify:CR=1 FL=1|jgi:hypothetical protein
MVKRLGGVDNFRSIPLLPDLRPMVKGKEAENFRSIPLLPDLRPMVKGMEVENFRSVPLLPEFTKVGNGDLVRKGLGGICAC